MTMQVNYLYKKYSVSNSSVFCLGKDDLQIDLTLDLDL